MSRYLDDQGGLRSDVTAADLLLWADGVRSTPGPVTVPAALVHGIAAALRSVEARAVAAETALADVEAAVGDLLANLPADVLSGHEYRVNRLTALLDVPDQPNPTGDDTASDSPCSTCEGTGFGYFGRKCPDCDGTGIVDVPDQPNTDDTINERALSDEAEAAETWARHWGAGS